MNAYVTGIGIISALGTNAEQNWQAIESARSGITYSEEYKVQVGKVSLSNAELCSRYGLEYDPYVHSRTKLLGLAAASEANGEYNNNHQLRCGLISSTSVGGMDQMELIFAQTKGSLDHPLHERMIFENGLITEEIAAALGLSGFVSTLSTACSSGANAIVQAARMVEAGLLDRVIAGGTDALSHYNVKGFSALGIYDPERCRPFDKTRKGLNLGEAAAYLVIESSRSIERTHSRVLCRITGWANTSDAYHQTASSANGIGATLAMKSALRKAGLESNEIGYVNAHGTATPINDSSESAAFSEVYGRDMPPFSSTKSYTGHTLAASGAVEAVYCIQALRAGALIPNLNFNEQIPDYEIAPQSEYTSGVSLRHVMTNSFGFGGNCTSLILSKAD